MSKEALKLALEALEQLQGGCTDHNDGTVEAITVWCPEVIAAIREALTEQPAQQEPVAWMWTHTKIGKVGVYFENPSQFFDLSKTSDYKWKPLYTSPPAQRTWVGLTDEDIDIAFDDTQEGGGFDDFARAIEAKLQEKNT